MHIYISDYGKSDNFIVFLLDTLGPSVSRSTASEKLASHLRSLMRWKVKSAAGCHL